VESSRWCRAVNTAKLINIGKVIENSNLDSLFRDDDPKSDERTTATLAQIKKHRKTAGLFGFGFPSSKHHGIDWYSFSFRGGNSCPSEKSKIEVVGRSPAL